MKRESSYRSYVSHEDLVPEVGVTTPDGCYCLLVDKSTTPVVSDVTGMADMVRRRSISLVNTIQCIHIMVFHMMYNI